MNLVKRIDRRLDDRRARINPHDFEDCATSLLTALFPELVPVVGGSDHGLDAEVTDDLERPPVGLIITSSRTIDGARKSLRSSLKSVIEHDLPVRRVMVANLAELNRSQRDKFKTIAAEFDCELVQIFDRAFFANQFRQHPDWRLTILGLTGGAFCLSRHPHQSRADDPESETVGRDALLTAVRATLHDTSADVLLYGVPGSGKSHIASRLPGALFLEDQPSPERLLDDLTAATPSVVVIDDAGGRHEELSRLLYVRRVENLAFRVVVTCWPHQRDLIADHLPHAEHHEVDLLTREEMGTLIRGRGVTRLAVVARILDQAQGRPAWALNLCDLIISGGDWKSLWTGNAVRSQILAYLRRSGTPAVAVDLLASIAILGAVTETQARRLGRLLEIPRLDLNQAITSVAVAGLIDVTQVPPHLLGNNGAVCGNDGEPESLYSVEPRIVAASIVASSYFSTRPSPVRISELRDEFPEKYVQIVQSQIHCSLLGADAPILCSQDQFAVALDAAESHDVEAELLRSYALCGLHQMRYVTAVLTERARNAWASEGKSATDRNTKRLAEQAADQLGENKPEPTRQLLALLAELAATGYDCTATIDLLVAEVRDAHSGDLPDAAGTLRLAEVLSDAAASSASRSGDQVLLCAALTLITPTFDGNYLSPENHQQLVMQSFAWPADHLTALFNAAAPAIKATTTANLHPGHIAALFKSLQDWVNLACDPSLPFTGQATTEQLEAARHGARELAAIISDITTTPGLRAKFNSTAQRLGISLAEPDHLFAALTARRAPTEDWDEWRAAQEKQLTQALAPYLRQPPQTLMTWIEANTNDLEIARAGRAELWRIARHLSNQPNVAEWLDAFLRHDLYDHSAALVEAVIARDELEDPLRDTLAARPATRTHLLDALLRNHDTGPHFEVALEHLTADDFTSIDASLALQEASDSQLHLLFTHPIPAVRGNTAALWATAHTVGSGNTQHDPTTHPDWVAAISAFSMPSPLEDYYERETLTVIARHAPDTYANVLTTYAHDPESSRLERFERFDTWIESVPTLTHGQRHRLWARIATTPKARELFWVLAAGDPTWVDEAFAREAVPFEPKRLLNAHRCQNGPGITFEQLVKIFIPLGVAPEDLLWLLELGTQFGEEHERAERHLKQCQDLAASSDLHLRQVGDRGVQIYEPRLAQTRREARELAVRGNPGW